MNSLLSFVAISALIIGYYIVFFVGDKRFLFNRIFLLFVVPSAFLIPLIPLNQFTDNGVLVHVHDTIGSFSGFSNSGLIIIPNDVVSSYSLSIEDLAIWIWVLGSFFLLMRFAKGVFYMMSWLKMRGENVNGLKTVITNKSERPFTLFRTIFLPIGTVSDAILDHERIHALKLHSIDLIYFSLIECLFWWNPFVWFVKPLAIRNHEAEADFLTLKKGYSPMIYSMLILNSSSPIRTTFSANHFSYFFIKTRLKMLFKKKKPTHVFLSALMGLLTLTVLISLSFSKVSNLPERINEASGPLILIDGGHGGSDNGAVSAVGNTTEKDLILDLLQEIASQSTERNLNIQFTRTTDKFISLEQRTAMAKEVNASLFVSLHFDFSEDVEKRGATIFHAGSSSKNHAERMAAVLSSGIFSDVKVQTANFYVLKNQEIPAVLIELGYLSNQGDLNNAKEGMSKMASSLLSAIEASLKN